MARPDADARPRPGEPCLIVLLPSAVVPSAVVAGGLLLVPMAWAPPAELRVEAITRL
jgi:hypothetical protein